MSREYTWNAIPVSSSEPKYESRGLGENWNMLVLSSTMRTEISNVVPHAKRYDQALWKMMGKTVSRSWDGFSLQAELFLVFWKAVPGMMPTALLATKIDDHGSIGLPRQLPIGLLR
ncbi:hypothetical protein VNO77_08632 [Canavalia gladiata]|uniref:Uncharacterized protein n=1 Tax=Canavalia gladiata TaxID=3824 RepID=A0AAN9M8M3_CANGL